MKEIWWFEVSAAVFGRMDDNGGFNVFVLFSPLDKLCNTNIYQFLSVVIS
jgi:hypothetical protein